MTTLSLFDPSQRVRIASAEFSECTLHSVGSEGCIPDCIGRLYRYVLEWPTGVDNDRICLWAMANPSTASASRLDPTVSRCVNYARAWGFGWCWVVNARAWRATDPKAVPPDPVAIGEYNDGVVLHAAWRAELVVCGWGALGGTRGPAMLDLVRRAGKVPHALKLTKDGEPGHPLYLRADAVPFPMSEAR